MGLSNPPRSYLQPSSAILGRLTHSLGSCSLSELFPDYRSPASVKKRAHSAVDSIPSRVPRYLFDRPACYGRITDFPETLLPFNGILELAPYTKRAVPCSLQFRSQAFSTSQRFPSRLKFHGLISCRNRSWAFSFRAFPSRRSCLPLSRPHAPLQLFTGLRRQQRSAPYYHRFPRRTCRWARLPCFTDSYGSPFHRPKPASRSPRTPSDTLPTYT
jgi:hypothetical protein